MYFDVIYLLILAHFKLLLARLLQYFNILLQVLAILVENAVRLSVLGLCIVSILNVTSYPIAAPIPLPPLITPIL